MEKKEQSTSNAPYQTWTRRLATWNTIGTLAGAGASWAAILIILYLEFFR